MRAAGVRRGLVAVSLVGVAVLPGPGVGPAAAGQQEPDARGAMAGPAPTTSPEVEPELRGGPRPLPGPDLRPGPGRDPRSPIPLVEPREPGPVPIPLVEPREPGPVPIPLVEQRRLSGSLDGPVRPQPR